MKGIGNCRWYCSARLDVVPPGRHVQSDGFVQDQAHKRAVYDGYLILLASTPPTLHCSGSMHTHNEAHTRSSRRSMYCVEAGDTRERARSRPETAPSWSVSRRLNSRPSKMLCRLTRKRVNSARLSRPLPSLPNHLWMNGSSSLHACGSGSRCHSCRGHRIAPAICLAMLDAEACTEMAN